MDDGELERYGKAPPRPSREDRIAVSKMQGLGERIGDSDAYMAKMQQEFDKEIRGIFAG